jgi:hypothetical protein
VRHQDRIVHAADEDDDGDHERTTATTMDVAAEFGRWPETATLMWRVSTLASR